MKLRNKKTGEIDDYIFEVITDRIDLYRRVGHSDTKNIWHYNSIAELNEEWEDMPEEEWRDVLGFEELYQVSNFGNVRTVKNGEAEMSQQENRNGYMTVHLRNKGVERRAMVHRLVAEAFIPNPDELRDVNHKNGNKSDNRVENLEWVSHSDNMAHSFRELGKNVRHIVQLDLDNNFIERWNSIIEASEATGICRTDIGECCRGNRKHTKGYKWKYEEDYEEPKGYWYYDTTSAQVDKLNHNEDKEIDSSIGNCFETKEEAEKAVGKLKALTRLRDKGFKILGFHSKDRLIADSDKKWGFVIEAEIDSSAINNEDDCKMIELLFGGEDE